MPIIRSSILSLVIAVGLTGGATATTINFNSDTIGGKANGFASVDAQA